MRRGNDPPANGSRETLLIDDRTGIEAANPFRSLHHNRVEECGRFSVERAVGKVEHRQQSIMHVFGAAFDPQRDARRREAGESRAKNAAQENEQADGDGREERPPTPDIWQHEGEVNGDGDQERRGDKSNEKASAGRQPAPAQAAPSRPHEPLEF